jgi:hypothetical protein
MTRTVNLGKIVVTMFLTALIWIWADLALDEEYPLSSAKISITKSVNPGLWVSFDGQSTVGLKKLVLKGSKRRIAEARRRINEGSLVPEFFLDPEHEQMTKAGSYPLDLAAFLKGADKISQLGLTVASCEPNIISVSVVELQKKQLTVKCFDPEQNPVKVTAIEPAQVTMFAPADWSGEALAAKVVLTQREVEQARMAPVQKTPFIELAAGQTRQASETVRITTPSQQERLAGYTITNVRLGFSVSANLQGKYRVELTNPDVVMGAVAIRATPEAKRAYEIVRYQVILEVDDSDKDAQATELRRELIYNFPQEFVRKDEITLSQPPAQARFKLVPLSAEPTQPAATVSQ